MSSPSPQSSASLPRLRVVSVQIEPKSALDALLAAGTIDVHQHGAGLAYAAVRRQLDRSGGWYGIPHEAWKAVKREHAALIRAAGAERFMLDRLCLDDDAPLRCEVERVRALLNRLAS